jgi:hypothetical protein
MQRKLSIKAGKHFTTLLNVLYNPFPEVTLNSPEGKLIHFFAGDRAVKYFRF